MNVLVSGASGFVGRNVMRELARQGSDAIALVRTGTANRSEIAIGDLADDAVPALPSAGALIHLAGRPHVVNERAVDPLATYRRVNLEGTRKLLEAARRAGVKRFVFVSTIKVLGEQTGPGHPFTQYSDPAPSDPYAMSKFEAEHEVRYFCDKHRIAWTIVRPVLVFGPGVGANFAALMNLVRFGLPLPFASIRNARSLIYVDNLAAFLVRAAASPKLDKRVVNLADAPPLSTPQLLRELAEAMGRRAALLHYPVGLLEMAGRLAGKSNAVLRLTRSLEVVVEPLFDELEWSPPVNFKDALKETASAFLRRR